MQSMESYQLQQILPTSDYMLKGLFVFIFRITHEADLQSEIAIRIQQKQLRLRQGALEEGGLKDFMTKKLIERADGM